ncbi:type II toxin-antitoxin system RelE/ParE family toxin [Spiractinospora alimapuensis]|nr:type II toxin-antitoxin system RelE/ParE family toxin [Spiractinospora alimapuensis]
MKTRYHLVIAAPVARALSNRLPQKVAHAVCEFITSVLLDNPRRVGKELLLPPYDGTYSARRGTYRVLYGIDDESRTVTVTAVEHRGDAYRSR